MCVSVLVEEEGRGQCTMLWMDHTSCGELAPEEAQPVSAPNHLDRASGSLTHQVPTLNTHTHKAIAYNTRYTTKWASALSLGEK